MEQYNDFSKAEPGHEVFFSGYGYVNLIDVIPEKDIITIATQSGDKYTTNLKGINKYGEQVVFWEKPEIVFQPDPKKLVKREFDVWIAEDEYSQRFSWFKNETGITPAKLTFEFEE